MIAAALLLAGCAAGDDLDRRWDDASGPEREALCAAYARDGAATFRANWTAEFDDDPPPDVDTVATFMEDGRCAI